jgi:hypothetical protein
MEFLKIEDPTQFRENLCPEEILNCVYDIVLKVQIALC